MHNNIMAAGSRDRPPMLATGRYPQWRSRFLRYIDTRPNDDALRKCILNSPYIPHTIVVQAGAATDDSLAIPEHTTVETPINMSPANKAHIESEKEAIHLILTAIGDEIYSTVDACQTAQEMWEAIERFVTIVKQQHKLDEVSYHNLFDILKQYLKEVNELCAERLARNANPLALVATDQANQDPYYQTSKSQKSYASSSNPSILSRSHTTTKYKGKEIAKPITPPSESASEKENNPEQAQRDKDMQKKPTNNNLKTSSNSRNKNVDTTPRYKNDNQSGQFGNQRMECRKLKRVKDSAYHKEKMLLCKQAKKGVSLQAKQYDWLTDMDEEIDEQELEAHYSYMAKIQEVPIADSGIDSEPKEQVQNDTGYNVFSNELQHSEQSESIKSDDERVALANLIANLKLDVYENKKIQKQLKKANTTLAQELKECKSILAKTSKTLGESNSVRDSFLVKLQNKQTEFEKYKAFNDRTVDYDKLKCKLNEALGQLAQKDIEIKEGLKLKAYEISVVKEQHDELIKQSLLTKSRYKGLVKQKTKVIADLKLKEEHDIDKMLSMEKQLKFLNEIIYKRSQSIQTIHMMEPKTCLMPLALKTQNDSFIFVHELKQEMHADLKYVKSLEKEIDELQYDKVEFSNMYDMILQECVSNEVICSYLLSLSDLDVLAELQCLYLPKVKEFWNEQALNVFRKEREQYIEIQDLKAQLQDKNIAINDLKKLIEKGKGKSVETKFDKPSVVRQPNAQRIPKPSVLGKLAPFSDSLERKYLLKTKSAPKTNVLEGLSKTVTAQTLPQTARQAVSNTNVLKPGMYQIDNRTIQTIAPQSSQNFRNTNPRVSTSTGVNHKTNVSRLKHRCNQMKDKVMQNKGQVKLKKTQVEDHPRIPSISNKIKSVTASSDSLNSRTLNVNAVCATCGKCLVNSDHFACVTKMLNDMNARTKKPNVVPISTRKPKGHANKSVATPHKKKVASKSTTQKPKSYYRMLYKKTGKAWKW
nr:hypothetical protein [Tanacetum cinerariifolium]